MTGVLPGPPAPTSSPVSRRSLASNWLVVRCVLGLRAGRDDANCFPGDDEIRYAGSYVASHSLRFVDILCL